MAMRILALVPEAATARRCLELAWAAAEVAQADLEAFHVKVDPNHLKAGDDEAALQRLRVPPEPTAEARAAATREAFSAWRQSLPPAMRERVRWREAVGAEEDAVARETGLADLVVVPSPHNLDGGGANHAAFRRSHRPLLYVPDGAASSRFGAHISIAWKPTPQAHRAVEGAAIWLRAARRISCLMVANDLEQGGWADAERLYRQLGVSVDPLLIQPTKATVGELLLSTATEVWSDTLVLGAYRHPDVVEWVLPSTTRYILHHTLLPLFMAH